ncbi:FHA domain-containing protein [Streptosporangium soli]|nr:FHA domain-containing protein [Streptosporangium sp. KLBMP 9127]
MTDQGFGVVRPLPGNGLVAHVGGLLLVCDAADAVVSELLGALRETAASGGDGRALARRAAQVLARDMSAAPTACAVAGPTAGGVAVLVSGEAAATVAAATGEVRLAGTDSLTWTDRLVPGPVSQVELRLPGAGTAHPQVRLDDGVVVGGGVSCDCADGGAAPARPLAAAPATSSHESFPAMPAPVMEEAPSPGGQSAMPARSETAAEHSAPAAEPPGPGFDPPGSTGDHPGPGAGRSGQSGDRPAPFFEPEAPPPPPMPPMGQQPPYPLGADPMPPSPMPPPPMPPNPTGPMGPGLGGPPHGHGHGPGPGPGPAYGHGQPSDPYLMPPPPADPMSHGMPPADDGDHDRNNGVPGEPFEAVLLVPDHGQGQGQGGQGEPEPPADYSEPEARPLVYGVDCKNDHFNDPRVPYCAVCGIALVQRTLVPYKGPRPPLGVLLLDDGMTLRLDTDYLVGRDPERAAEVASGTARPAKVTSPDGSVSRRHLRVALDGWDVNLVDLGSVNGTQIQPPGDPNFYDIPPNEAVSIAPGTTVRIGVSRTMRYESHRNR